MQRARFLTSLTVTLLFVTGVFVPNPSFGETGGDEEDISGGGPKGFDPAACVTTQTSGLTMGDILSCLAPEPQTGPAAGIPGDPDPKIGRAPGASYAGMYGEEPKPPPFPDGCDTPVHGTWTQDQGVVNKISRKNGRTVFETTLSPHWTSGVGEGGRSIGHFDIWIEPEGYAVGVGRELFEGTIGGRTGSMTMWSVTFVERTGRYFGRGFAIGGTEGLANIRLEAGSVGLVGKGGHWTEPSRVCFAD